jgi:hypothetical protein
LDPLLWPYTLAIRPVFPIPTEAAHNYPKHRLDLMASRASFCP